MFWKSVINKILYKFNLRILRPFPRPFQKHNLMDKKDLIGVEIGVDSGNNAYSLLKRSSIKRLYLIDPYFIKEEDKLLEDYYYSNDYLSYSEDKAKDKLRNFADKIIWIKKKSEDAVNELPNNLDFVYIDGNHAYEFVKKDIELYYPKLKKGGLLAGYDFTYSPSGVIQAVLEFVNKNNLKLNVEESDWWIIKKK